MAQTSFGLSAIAAGQDLTSHGWTDDGDTGAFVVTAANGAISGKEARWDTVGNIRIIWTSGPSDDELKVLARLYLDSPAAPNESKLFLHLREDDNNGITAGLRFDGASLLAILGMVDGGVDVVDLSTAFTYIDTQPYFARVEYSASGLTLKVKIWRGNLEPTAWTWDLASGDGVTAIGNCQVGVSVGEAATIAGAFDWVGVGTAGDEPPYPPIPRIVAVGTIQESTGASVTPTIGAGVAQAGDRAIVVATHTDSLTRAISFASGWTERDEQTGSSGTGGDPRAAWATKDSAISSGEASSGFSVQVDRSGTGTTVFIAYIVVLRGWNGNIDDTDQLLEVTATPSNEALTPTGDNSLCLSFVCQGDNDAYSGEDAPWAMESQQGTDTGTDARIATLSYVHGVSGTSTPTFTLSKTGTDGHITFTFNLPNDSTVADQEPSLVGGKLVRNSLLLKHLVGNRRAA